MANSKASTDATIALIKVAPNACSVSGILNFSTTPQLLEQWQAMFFLSDGGRPQENQTPVSAITIDLAGLSKADSAAVAFCVAAVRQGSRYQRAVKFINPPSSLVAIAKIVRLESIFQ